MCWIPIIGQALAGALLLIAAISAVVAAVANIVLAATGERTWGQAAPSVIGAALACIGLGAAAGAGAAAFKVLMENGARMAARKGSTGLAKLLAGGLLRPGALARMAKAGNFVNIKGMLGEEVVNSTQHSGKAAFKVFNFSRSGAKLATTRMGQPDGVIKLFGKYIFAECKNVGYNVASKTLSYTNQLRGYVDLAIRECGGKLHVFVNAQTITTSVETQAGSSVVFHTFENVLGTKINAWVQAGVGTALKAESLLGH